jgi:hypothetical protein
MISNVLYCGGRPFRRTWTRQLPSPRFVIEAMWHHCPRRPELTVPICAKQPLNAPRVGAKSLIWRRERSATRNILHFRAHPRGNVARVEI